jgi:hypothetical protein
MPSIRAKILIVGQIACLVLISFSLYLGRDKLTSIRVPSFVPGSTHGESSQVGKNDTAERMCITNLSLLHHWLTSSSGRRSVACKQNSLSGRHPRCASDTPASIILSTARRCEI